MNGVVPLNKEIGKTSSDYVYVLRKVLKTKKIGHTGTLDPLVNGVLPICVGQATKLVNLLTNSPKEYEGEITLGRSTTTEDREGDTVEQTKLEHPIELDRLNETFQSMTGELKQIPPMFSAVKVNGRKLYEYARAGETVERPVRDIMIYDFHILGDPKFDQTTGLQTLRFHVRCSKGTYVRTLAVEFGERLNLPAFMSQLTRTKSAGYTLDDTFKLSDIESMVESGSTDFIKSIDDVLDYIPAHQLSNEEWDIKVSHGGFLDLPDADIKQDLRVTKDGVTKAIYQWDTQRKTWVPDIMLLKNE
ncbi:tRNA pseudouridine(55) synthase TruB [Companilactobacillus sp.]|jgi:tRNA pseudouridine55 synthase|uniref:tRNA pseudouridine(55) synthase TruB n=1 Tax=Companilactobacillus sp. TaxID=2767905 RepID=UPI0025B89BFD|nr:tRNA pseudouridine(55) synthase TruB [Companilactobacillus sp.]MCH4008090.1 tRNA pseudouridine(55) synthase TruB [Companilactobacillus sp.]MCH4051731.1 tRNA pseudouridine(55) synthase TruB [Companilactobacillus sp.]MCH4076033.1 tRNA pseudouridine(55) synthase TruB [Companilactobacillus sp.]MCH4124608.1 tRNA pseudouridine(55) synthase TruB [Companilactobacillus sp.]MCH4132429.1 tRNA pseudouridine(55) synthase TruB [Companilactobacillus sp.]